MTNTTTRCACGYNLDVAPCPYHGMDQVQSTPSIYVRANAESHVIHAYHGEIMVSRAVNDGSGAWENTYAHCTHHHADREAAETCAARAQRFGERNNGRLPNTYIDGVRP